MRVEHTSNTFTDYLSRWRRLLLLLLILQASPLPAAQVTITLTDNATGLVAADTPISAYRIENDGARKRVARQNTDANGQLILDLENIENGTRYQFTTRAFNSTELYSEVVSNVSDFNFVAGRKIIQLKNGAEASHAALANYRVDVKTPKEDGKLRWVTRAISDANGTVRFNLEEPNLQYVFAARSTLTNQEKRTDLSSATGQQEFVVGHLPLNISLVHGITGMPVPAQRIEVRRIAADGSKSWAGRRETDKNGNAVFDLEGLGEGSVFELYTRNSDGFFATKTVSQPGTEQFRLGNARVLILNGREAAQPPHIAKQVTVFKQVGESRERVLSVKTDANGQILLDLKELAAGTQYIARLRHDNKHYEAPITESGDSSAVFGQLPQIISATVFNTATNTPVAGERVNLLRWDGDKKRHVSRAETNANGQVEFDAQGLYENQIFLVRINPFDGAHIESDNLTKAGNVNFNVNLQKNGFQVQVLDGTLTEPAAIANQRVDVFRMEGDSLKYYTRRDTDGSGNVAFTLPDFDKGQQYVLQTRHTENGRQIRSAPFSDNGSHVFTVGTIPLSISLLNPVTNAPIKHARIDVMRSREDGSSYREARLNTDENGLAVFHLSQISESSPATLRSWSEEGFYAEQQITSTGPHNVVFGNTQITLRNGRDASQAVLDNHRVRIFKYAGEQRSKVFDRDSSDEGIALMRLDRLTGEDYYQAEVTIGGDRYQKNFNNTGDVQLTFGNHQEDVQVALLDGTSTQPTPITRQIIAIHRMDGDRLKWVSNKETDEEGKAKLALPGLSQGEQFVLKARHPISGKWFESDPITKESRRNSSHFTFVVGAPALVINLTHPGNGTAMVNTRIDVHRESEDPNKWRREAREQTDENGQAIFYLKDISATAPIELRMRSEEGFWAATLLTSTGTHNLPFGNVPVTVLNKEGNLPIANKRLEVFRMDENNELHREARYNTTAHGEVLLELDSLADGTRYALRVHNPFGENKRYFGPIVYREGAIEFLVAKGEQTELDLTDPEVFITSPTRDNVNGLGFLLGGVASDNNSIRRIEVSVSDPVKGISQGEAILLDNGQWQFSIGESAITLEETITVTATAYDQALNSAQYSKSFNVVEDVEPPTISIVSHKDNDNVNETGFTVIGEATDDTGVVTVTATLTDPVLGNTIEEQSVSVAEDGQWALIVTNSKVSGGQTAALSLTATDSSDKTTNIAINLMVQTIVPQQQQLISRITFGITPELYINQPDATRFMRQQLNPASIDDAELEAQIAAMQIVELEDLRARQLHYMLYSRRQLNEVMTWFWDNHFNTNFNAHQNVAFEMAENDGFRQNALGNFRDLLAISAKSPAMIYYLNNAQNVVGRPNENYAREIMELSTMGVDGGYTAQDISELARIFTGWHEQAGAFFFNAEQHDFGTKSFLGATIEGEGLAEGEQALDILAAHPSTARHICRKLITLFVSDEPVNALQGQCEGQFLASNGDIASVVQVILSSEEFVSLEHQGNKIKTPLEMILAAIRSVNATPDYDQINDTLGRLAYSLFTYPVPTGLAETGASWINSNALLERIRFANKFALEGKAGASVDLMALLMTMGYSSADAIVGVLADLTLNGGLTDLERDIATALLNENIAEGESFSMQSPDAEQKLQRLLGTMLSYPAFQYQ